MKITFVYNADSGTINALLDIGHKLLSPDTYSCNLCAITHGVLREKEVWKIYKSQTSHDLEFLHKDEFEKAYGLYDKFTYPLILNTSYIDQIEVLVSTAEINQLSSVAGLIACLPQA